MGKTAGQEAGEVATRACAECLDWLDSWIDAQAGDPAEHAAAMVEQVDRHLRCCEACGEEARWALEVQRSLHELPTLECPDSVAEGVERARRRLAAERFGPLTERFARWRRALPLAAHPSPNSPLSGLLAAAALVAALALAATWLLSLERPAFVPTQVASPTPSQGLDLDLQQRLAAEGYSLADLERAEKEAKVAFAMLGAVSQRAGLVLRDDVLREQVALAPRRALSRWASGGGEPAAGDPAAGDDG